MGDDINVFDDVDEQSQFVWMRHGDGQPAAFPRGSVDAWRVKGWEPCEAPPDVDPVLAEHVPLAAATPAAVPEPEPVAKPAKTTTAKTSKEMSTDG